MYFALQFDFICFQYFDLSLHFFELDTYEFQFFFVSMFCLCQFFLQHLVSLLHCKLFGVPKFDGLSFLNDFNFILEHISLVFDGVTSRLVGCLSQMIKLFLFVNIFFENGIKFLFRLNKSFINFAMNFAEWVLDIGYKCWTLVKNTWKSADLRFSWCLWKAFRIQSWLHLAAYIDVAKWLCCPARKVFVSSRLNTSLSFFNLFDFGFELLQISPEFLKHRSIEIRIVHIFFALLVHFHFFLLGNIG